MTIDWPVLRAASTTAASNAYAPYSRLRVGAAGQASNGTVVTGCNVENASFGLTLCAECGLVSALHAAGAGRLVGVSVVAADGAPLVPCGRCRQLLLEAGGAGLLIDSDDGPRKLGTLLPDAFTAADISWLIGAYTRGLVADEQMSAMAMAVFFRGLAPAELRAWTGAMVASGRRLDLGAVPAPTVDKHSTGGVGDKVSLILAPLVASCGAAVPQLSGRGLGHTGGTLDKLEAIPGWRAGLSAVEFVELLATVGCVICAAGEDLAPADRKLYALRDVTGTVESIPLIASSIMSKKIAEGTQSLVLDVKVGRGAFMRERDAARDLAQTMVRLGTESGVRTTALLTAMDCPLGQAVGNAVEVAESVQVLHGGGDEGGAAAPDDLVAVTLALAREMLALAGIDADPA